MQREISLDFETKCELDVTKVGLDVYSSHPSCAVQMCSWTWDRGRTVFQWTEEDGTPFPQEVISALEDPSVIKRAFNAQFERIIARRVLKIKTPYKGWRCTMVMAYMLSFVGGLEQVGAQMGIDDAHLKNGKRGKYLVKFFSGPRKPTKADPTIWRDYITHPELWEEYKQYNRQDVVAECAIVRRLIKFPIQEFEWELYELDQETNDRGLPVDMVFVENAIVMANRRRAELTDILREATGLTNPNSPAQLLGWLQDRGYRFNDLRADTVKKILTEQKVLRKEENPPAEIAALDILDDEVVEVLKTRQQVARTSVKKYDKIKLFQVGGRLRFGFQFAGAQRTNRAAGRIINPQNLTRTPKELEPDKSWLELGVEADFMLVQVTEMIRRGDYEMLKLTVKEPMDALAGTVRSAICAPDDKEIIACDLSSIETCIIGWVSGCERLMNVFRNGKDPYIDFATDMFSKKYEDVTKRQRQESKPAVLGAGFRLGGGQLREGKRTGLWGYAESMGVDLSLERSHKAVSIYRENFPEVPQLWYALENAAERAIRTGSAITPVIRLGGRVFRVPVTFEMMKPFLTIILPSGRRMYYHKPRLHKEIRYTRPTPEYPDGKPYEKVVASYMGREQGKNAWKRIVTHGGKWTENIVQAIARDILMYGYRRAWDAGFKIVGHVHDELMALVKKGEKLLTVALLRQLMIVKDECYEGLPLNAAGSAFQFYRKD